VALHKRIIGHLKGLVQRAIGFARRQTYDFRVMLARRALHGIGSGLSAQYGSIYATFLGADAVQLGSLGSVGNAIGALASIPAGWFIDYYSLKKVFLLGTVMLVVSRVLYFVAPHWAWLYAGTILYYLGMRITCTSCTVTCATELPNEERATGRGFCRTLSSIVAISIPLVAAGLISLSGGINVRGIRSLYAIEGIVFVGVLVLLMTQLRDSHGRSVSAGRGHILSGFAEVFKHGPDVMRLVLVMGLIELPWSMTTPFMPLYARDFKGADQFVLGGIAIAMTVVPMLASIPLGRLADRRGRKKLLFALAPLAYLANLSLVLAPPAGASTMPFLLLYGVLFGFNSISMALVSSMAAEIMPKDQMGRWIGTISLFRGLLSIPAPLIGGLIWEHVGPQYVFFAAIAVDVFLRLPLLASVRETLHLASAGD
jgi:MFS family permease